MTRKRGRSAKRTVRRSNAAGLTALELCFTRQLQLQPHVNAIAGKPAGAPPTARATNLVFSPVSVYAALALLAAGARGGTLQEILDTLGRDDLAGFTRRTAEPALADRSRSGGPAVAFACGAWIDAAWAILPAFRDAAAASYNAEARAVDFANEPEKAVAEINGSLAAATSNHIDSILDPSSVNTLTPLVLASAIYFKGRWEAPFAKALTVVDKFHRLDGSTADVPFMCSARSQFIAVRDGFKVLKLPYRSPAPPPPSAPAPRKRMGRSTPSESKPAGNDRVPKYSLYVFLPDERDGLPGLVKKMASGCGFWKYRLPTSQVPVGNFRLPKFKVSVSGSVREVLRDGMGIESAFVAGEADLADMATTKRDEDDAANAGEVDRADMATTKHDVDCVADAGEADLADMETTKRDEDDAADAGEADLADMETTKRDEDDAADAGEADLDDMDDAADAGEADLVDMATMTKSDEDDAADAGEADLADMETTKRNDDAAADAGTPPLYVADVCHKAVLEVNEGGPVTIGGTASYMRCGASAVMDELATVDFVADHPFLFFVIEEDEEEEEESRAIVFVGRVLDPSVSG